MLDSYSEAGRQRPVSCLVGWEYELPTGLEVGEHVEQRHCRRESSPGIMAIQKKGPQEQNQFVQDRKQLSDVSVGGAPSASISRIVGHIVCEDAELEAMEEGVTTAVLPARMDDLNSAQPDVAPQSMEGDTSGGLLNGICNFQSVFLSEGTGAQSGRAVEIKSAPVMMEIKASNGETPSEITEDKASELSGTTAKRKGIEEPQEAEAVKRPKSDISKMDVEYSGSHLYHGSTNHDRLNCSTGAVEGAEKDQGSRLVANGKEEIGNYLIERAVEGYMEGGDRSMSSINQVDNAGCELDVLFGNQVDKSGGDKSTAELEFCAGNLGSGCGPAHNKVGDSQGTCLEFESNKKEGIKGPGLETHSVDEGGEQNIGLEKGVEDTGDEGAVLENVSTKGDLQKCTDLTDLLDELSGGSDDFEDLCRVEAGKDFELPQKPADTGMDASETLVSGQSFSMKMSREPEPFNTSCSHGLHPEAALPIELARGSTTTIGKTGQEVLSGEVALSASAIQRVSARNCPAGPSGCEELSTSRSPPRKRQLPNVAESLVMHMIDVSVDMMRKDGDSGPMLQEVNLVQRSSSAEVVVLDSDSDKEDTVMCDRSDESCHFRNAVKFEHEIRRNLMHSYRVVEDAKEDKPLASSITTSGRYQHTLPLEGPPLRDVSSHGTRLSGSPGLSAPGNTLYSQGHVSHAGSDRGASSSGRPVSSSMQLDRSHKSTQERTQEHTPRYSTGHSKATVSTTVEERRKAWVQVGPNQWVRAEQLQPGTRAGNFVHSRLSQSNAVQNSNSNSRAMAAPDFKHGPQQPVSLPHQNGQAHSSLSMKERLLQASKAASSVSPEPRPLQPGTPLREQAIPGQSKIRPISPAVVPSRDDAAYKERISPPSTYSSPKRTTENMRPPGYLPMKNRPSTSTPLLQEKKRAANCHTSRRHKSDFAGPSRAEPGSDNSTAIPRPQTAGNSHQLVTVQPGYDSTISTPRAAVMGSLKSYDHHLEAAKRKMGEQRRDMAYGELGSDHSLGMRVDIQAYNDVKLHNEDVNRGLVVGDVPGVEVGDMFLYRHQMAVIGLHHLPNVGIGYGYPVPENIITATAIVCAPKGGYADNVDDGYRLLYTGQGGRAIRGHASPFVEHQKLEKGNKALCSNLERKVPVRVIRGHANLANNPSNRKVLGYTYDGLYMVMDYRFEEGKAGFNVYKFSLVRVDGQPPIAPCLQGCTAHPWNATRHAVVPIPLQMVEPEGEVENGKQILN